MGLVSWATLALGAVYTFTGIIKIFPFPKAAYDQQVKDFKDFARVFPLRGVGIAPDDTTYRLGVGVAEMVLGAGLLFTGSDTRRLCCLGCMVIMAGAVYTLVQLNKPAMALAPGAFFLALLWLYRSLP